MMLIRSILQSIFLLAATQTIAAGHNSMITYQIGDNEYKAFVADQKARHQQLYILSMIGTDLMTMKLVEREC